jgi:K+-transporting ATPase ATPase C chain
MVHELKTALRPAISFLLLLALITGLAYPLIVLGLGQALFPHQANGSLIREPGSRSGGGSDRIIGSELVGQAFADPRYFHPRPSAAGDGYDAAASSGSNLGPASADLAAAVAERVAAARAEGQRGPVPAHAATASGSGLDPHVSPAMALGQVERVAAARGLPADTVRRLVEQAVRGPTLGILGAPHVNILLLNRQLDAVRPNTAP